MENQRKYVEMIELLACALPKEAAYIWAYHTMWMSHQKIKDKPNSQALLGRISDAMLTRELEAERSHGDGEPRSQLSDEKLLLGCYSQR